MSLSRVCVKKITGLLFTRSKCSIIPKIIGRRELELTHNANFYHTPLHSLARCWPKSVDWRNNIWSQQYLFQTTFRLN